MEIQHWNGHNIRFVEVNGEWMAVGKDVALTLEYVNPTKAIRDHVDDENKGGSVLDTPGGKQELIVIDELGIYDLVFNSKMPQAKQFKRWVHSIIRELRKSVGLKAYQAFEMFDTKHQKEAMARLQQGLKHPSKIDYVKANIIANKSVSNQYGFPKMLAKRNMTPEMKRDRESVLDDTVQLMKLKDRYGLDLSVSETIYSRGNSDQTA
ncbi:BRO-N domain-containing protein [Loigolactobacillus bifermentans]|uniref:Bro-N domain-containing protein n=1 Tax=Loigolactobacillus bifermentans DSM 20003 TaxID=1423726 RepID=A0A0R1H1A8_9LACO|nr:BRO family protein [Loigolactobacillus bifermentans]KRK40395.1 hypothetical protein FC07_GL000954 [Loigolactobacillus bifermentans DSM 20003]QGG59739.1 phage repressor protein [Loigolactobacillus bifermentans]